jgi:hypothetical protein
MSTLEFPPDVANKIVGMLKPKERPFAVMIFSSLGNKDNQYDVKIKCESLSLDEIQALGLDKCRPSKACRGGDFYNEFARSPWFMDEWVHAALSMEFVFRTEADRARWQNRESFEMYRDAVRWIE